MNKPNPGSIDRAVLAERLELALALPERVASWHWLYDALAGAGEPMRQPVLGELRRRRPRSALGALHAATLLDSFTPDLSELSLAADALVEGRLPMDASQAFLGVALARCLRESSAGDALMCGLTGSGALRVCAHVGQRLIETAAAGLPPRSAQAAVGSAAGTARSRRIAIVAPSLSTGFHAPTTMALAHACVLVESGCQVEVFAPQESMLPRMVDWLGTPRRMSLSDAERSRWPVPARGTYRVRLPNLALTMRGRWLWLLAAVQGFAPEAVFFIGAQSPLLWPLQRGWPTLGLSTNAIPPLGPVDLWLAPDAAPREWGRPLATPAQRVHTQRFRVERAADSFDLAPLGLPADAVLWLTSTSRANGELRADWCDAVFQALARHPRAHWLVLRSGAALPVGFATRHPQLRILDFQTELGALMRRCAMHLNPPRVGGGHSVAMAMAHGLPTLALRGGDGADKLGDAACADLAQYVTTLDAWMNDAALREQAGAAQRARFEQQLDIRRAGPRLLQALDDLARP